MEAFTWMFRTEGFKKHYLFLCLSGIVLFLLSGIFGYGAYYSLNLHNMLITILLAVIAIFCFISMGLLPSGYFWYLTCSAAERQQDFQYSNVYDGTFKETIKVELPEIKPFAFIWRGFASFVATMLLIYPVLILIVITAAGSAFSGLNNLPALFVSYGFFFLFLGMLIPGLLWNYAVRNSIIAVWNIPKAIHLLGTYTGRYVLHTALYLLICFTLNILFTWLKGLFGIDDYAIMSGDIASIIKAFVFYYLVLNPIFSYILFVYAYLLGTIAPSGEI